MRTEERAGVFMPRHSGRSDAPLRRSCASPMLVRTTSPDGCLVVAAAIASVRAFLGYFPGASMTLMAPCIESLTHI